VLDSLVDGEDRYISGVRKATLMDEPVEALEDGSGPVRQRIDAVDVVGTRKVERLFRYPFA
jgi:hypothetical protein